MALIKCPECGQEVSDKSATCIKCGFPLSSLKTDGTVRIKLEKGGMVQINVYEVSTGKVLASGRNGQILSFHVDKPTEIAVGAWSIKNAKNSGTMVVEAGKKYERVTVQGFMSVGWRLQEVDILDSD